MGDVTWNPPKLIEKLLIVGGESRPKVELSWRPIDVNTSHTIINSSFGVRKAEVSEPRVKFCVVDGSRKLVEPSDSSGRRLEDQLDSHVAAWLSKPCNHMA